MPQPLTEMLASWKEAELNGALEPDTEILSARLDFIELGVSLMMVVKTQS